MIECNTILRNWGNSVGIVIPRSDVKKENLKPHQKVRVIILPEKPTRVKDLLGKCRFRKPTDQILRQTDEELDSKFTK